MKQEPMLLMMMASVAVGRWIPPLALWLLARREDGSALGFAARCRQECPLQFRGPLGGLCPDCAREMDRLRLVVPLGLMPVAAAVGMGPDPLESWLRLLLVWVLAVLVLTDAWAMLIPDAVTLPGLVLFAAVRAAVSPEAFLPDLAAAAGVWGVCWLVARTGGGLGMGDGKLLALAGLVVGWPHILLAFWLGSVFALAFLGWRLAAGRRTGLREPIPFGPHLAAGVIIVLVWAEPVSRWWSALWTLGMP